MPICSNCRDVNKDARPGERCKVVRYGNTRCAGYYVLPQYRVFDLASKRYLTKDKSADVFTEAWAGIFDFHELDPVLQRRYGTSDRQIVARRATLLLVK